MTAEKLISGMWKKCRVTAQQAESVPAEAVQKLIEQTREILTSHGSSQYEADIVLYGLYLEAHWDWPEPTARVFESLLEIELARFFRERMKLECNH